LPKQKKFCKPVACIRYGFSYLFRPPVVSLIKNRGGHEGERDMRMLSMGMMATSFVLGIGIIAVAFILGKMILDARRRSLNSVMALYKVRSR
jgi:hypothetical protein